MQSLVLVLLTTVVGTLFPLQERSNLDQKFDYRPLLTTFTSTYLPYTVLLHYYCFAVRVVFTAHAFCMCLLGSNVGDLKATIMHHPPSAAQHCQF